jgi:hypothetical protein
MASAIRRVSGSGAEANRPATLQLSLKQKAK